MSVKIFSAPSKYIQGDGIIDEFGSRVMDFGNKFFIIADEFVMDLLAKRVSDSFGETQAKLHFETFKGETTYNEIERLLTVVNKIQSDAIIGIGGGKTLDTAKVVASKAGIPIIIIPTIAATNAASSAGSVIYNEAGEFVSVYRSSRNPELVFVDVDLIARAPVRMLVAGMGDALAAYYEARACRRTDADTLHKAKATNGAFAFVTLCDAILMADGLEAKKAVENQGVNTALENVAEAILFLSGVGFESNGLAAAHAVAKGFTAIPESHDYLHGEWVAFGTLVQLVLEKAPRQELEKVLHFLNSVGLPMSLDDLGQADITAENLEKVAGIISAVPSMSNMPIPVSSREVAAALIEAGALGRAYKEGNHA